MTLATRARIRCSSFSALHRISLSIATWAAADTRSTPQSANIFNFANFVLFSKPLADDVKRQLTTNPYLNAGTYERYYGGLQTHDAWAGAGR